MNAIGKMAIFAALPRRKRFWSKRRLPWLTEELRLRVRWRGLRRFAIWRVSPIEISAEAGICSEGTSKDECIEMIVDFLHRDATDLESKLTPVAWTANVLVGHRIQIAEIC
jgi:hypothetical protein